MVGGSRHQRGRQVSQDIAGAADLEPSPPLALGVAWGEHDWQAIAESIPHIVFVARPDGSGEYINQQGTDYTGLGPGPDYAWGWTRVIHPDDEDLAHGAWLEAIKAVSPFALEYRIRRVDGSYRWHNVRAQPVRDGAGQVVKWVGTATDVDDQKRFKHHLAEAQRTTAQAWTLLDTLQAAAPVGFGFVDRQFRFVRLNQELATLNGATIDDHLGRTVAEVVPRLWERLEGVYRHVLDSGEAVRNLPLTEAHASDDGHVHDWVGGYYPVKIDDEIVGVGVVAVDITDRVRAEDFWSTFMSQVSDGVCAVDAAGRLTYMNRSASAMLGWRADELVGQHLHDVIHFQEADGTPITPDQCPLLTGPQGRVVQRADQVFTRKDGSTFGVACSAMPLHTVPGANGVAVVFRDVSEQDAKPNMIRVLIAHSHKTTGEGFETLLNRQEGIEVVATAKTSAAAVAAVQRLRPDIVVIDDDLPNFDAATTPRVIKAKSPSTRVILITETYSDSIHVSGIASGCAGVVEKGQAWVDLAGAVRAVHSGEGSISQADLQRVLWTVSNGRRSSQGTDLTKREREVLACLKEGCSNSVAADRLGLTTNTVRNHVQRILYKLNVHSKLEAVVVATRDGLLDED